MIPNPSKYNPDENYLRELIAEIGVSQREIARIFCIGFSTLKDYLNSNHSSKAPYSLQYALECWSKKASRTDESRE